MRGRAEQSGGLLKTAVLAVTLIAAAAGLSGCPALLIPSLGYEAYKYEKSSSSPASSKNSNRNHRESSS